MKKLLPIILWLLVAVCGAVLAWNVAPPAIDSSKEDVENEKVPGAVLVDVPWEHLPDIDQFRLTNQNGGEFDSAKMIGKPYAVSFFFASCPSICRDLSAQVSRLNEQLRKEDISFVSISVDPENDTPEVLNRYAQDYDAQAPRWSFLTGPKYKVVEIGSHQFHVDVNPATHTGNILLVDKWGRYRDRFKWDDPYDMKRFLDVVKEVANEAEPPLGKMVTTRYSLAGQKPNNLKAVPWLHEFHLIDQSETPFFSRDLTGQVWVANFFFVDCPGVCKQQNEYLAGLQTRLEDRLGQAAPQIYSITSDPTKDTPDRLNVFAKQAGANPNRWHFLTSQSSNLIRRVGAEFFGVEADQENHSSLLFVIDRWSNLRGKFDWQKPEEEIKMFELIEDLQKESIPTGAKLR